MLDSISKIAAIIVAAGILIGGVFWLAQLDADVRYVQTDVAQLQTDVTHVQTDVTQLKTDVTHLQTDVAQVQTDVTHVQTDVTQLKTDVTHLQTDVAQVQTDVTQVQTDMTQLKTDVTHLQTDVTHLQTDVTQVQTDVTQLQLQVADVQQNQQIILGILRTLVAETQQTQSPALNNPVPGAGQPTEIGGPQVTLPPPCHTVIPAPELHPSAAGQNPVPPVRPGKSAAPAPAAPQCMPAGNETLPD